MLEIMKNEAAKPSGDLSSSRMLGAWALKWAGFPDTIWAPLSIATQWRYLIHKGCFRLRTSRLSSYHSGRRLSEVLSHFLGGPLFSRNPALDSCKADTCSLPIEAGMFGCFYSQLQNPEWRSPVSSAGLVTSVPLFTQE